MYRQRWFKFISPLEKNGQSMYHGLGFKYEGLSKVRCLSNETKCCLVETMLKLLHL